MVDTFSEIYIYFSLVSCPSHPPMCAAWSTYWLAQHTPTDPEGPNLSFCSLRNNVQSRSEVPWPTYVSVSTNWKLHQNATSALENNHPSYHQLCVCECVCGVHANTIKPPDTHTHSLTDPHTYAFRFVVVPGQSYSVKRIAFVQRQPASGALDEMLFFPPPRNSICCLFKKHDLLLSRSYSP